MIFFYIIYLCLTHFLFIEFRFYLRLFICMWFIIDLYCRCVEAGIRTSLALQANINTTSFFDRKVFMIFLKYFLFMMGHKLSPFLFLPSVFFLEEEKQRIRIILILEYWGEMWLFVIDLAYLIRGLFKVIFLCIRTDMKTFSFYLFINYEYLRTIFQLTCNL